MGKQLVIIVLMLKYTAENWKMYSFLFFSYLYRQWLQNSSFGNPLCVCGDRILYVVRKVRPSLHYAQCFIVIIVIIYVLFIVVVDVLFFYMLELFTSICTVSVL